VKAHQHGALLEAMPHGFFFSRRSEFEANKETSKGSSPTERERMARYGDIIKFKQHV
jgi:hypothetical protein